ncbi:MAG: EAL domain-containing protein [Rhizobiaceae bacterium]|nr:EAL domain-containing protein [Rhizobiaceae bacterium]
MKNTKNSIPDDIYAGFIRSLFNDPAILLIGAFCHGLMGLLTWYTSGESIYIWLASAMLAAGLYRYFGILRGQKVGPFSVEMARKWELRYLIGGTLQAFFMGMFAFVALVVKPDPFGELAAVAVIMGSTVTIVGRNYGSAKMVAVQTFTVVLPIALGLMLKGEYPYVALGLFIVPFIYIITRMAGHVREVLFAAISQEKISARIAERFDRALNTMSHGLVMLSPEGRVVVANSEAAKALQFQRPDRLLGRSLRAVLMRGVAGGLLSYKDVRYVETQLTRALGEGRDRKLQIRSNNGRYYELSARAGNDQLGVITFEEITARVEAEERIRHMARFDSLTNLPNRGWFHELVGELMASGDGSRHCAIVVFDLDDFKTVNDTLGHPIGDGMICAVAEKLARFASDEVKVSRFGGDEFIIFFNRVSGEAELTALIDQMFLDLQGTVDVQGHALKVQLSAGTVISRVRETDVDAMIVKADLALYRAKELGKNRWCLFESTMDAEFRSRQTMKADLRSAVEQRQLRVVYQPIVALSTMRIASCEALCRWDHPELGAISPGIFIPLAEEIGIIADISTFVLEQACAECVKWPESVSVSVNLSAKDFHSRDVVEKVRAALDQAGLAPHRLEIEVTETALLDDKSSTRAFLEELKSLGVRIALDDFGTGYSSLSYLHTLPLDKVKIDRSFVIDITQNERSLILLTKVCELSRGLGMLVTIEGVETFEQLKLLAGAVDPDLVQGFLFGAALTSTGIDTMSNMTWPFAGELRAAARSQG